MSTPLTALLAGAGRMGQSQARILANHPDFRLLAVCDLDLGKAQACAAELQVRAYPDLGQALAAENPEVVVICSHNTAHAPMTLQAAAAPGVRGIYCEKPMATNLRDARAMTEACAARGLPLVINHQRRVQPDLVEARRLIAEGALGRVYRLRGQCQGDVLSDGTHTIDSLLWLAGDQPADWVFGQIHREPKRPATDPSGDPATPVTRYGHLVESGAMAVVQLRDGPRLELFFGDMVEARSPYQNYHVYGTEGRLWRAGDLRPEILFQSDPAGGEWVEGIDEWMFKPVPGAAGTRGSWRPVPLPAQVPKEGIRIGYSLFAESVRRGAPHPMDASHALRGFEIVMAIYESARLGARLPLPLQQDRFPLELMP